MSLPFITLLSFPSAVVMNTLPGHFFMSGGYIRCILKATVNISIPGHLTITLFSQWHSIHLVVPSRLASFHLDSVFFVRFI
jgi:hypothetical protein